MIAFRKAHSSIGRSSFWNQQTPDVQWYGVGGNTDQSDSSHSLAYLLRGTHLNDSDLYVMINAYWEPLTFAIQDGEATAWKLAVDTSQPSPDDIFDTGTEPPIASLNYNVQPRSIVVLLRN
jgi:isoamylase